MPNKGKEAKLVINGEGNLDVIVGSKKVGVVRVYGAK